MFTDKQTAKMRMDICKACPNLALNLCKECGCFMPAKTKLAWTECPIGKWGKVGEAPKENQVREEGIDLPLHYINDKGHCCVRNQTYNPNTGEKKEFENCWLCSEQDLEELDGN